MYTKIIFSLYPKYFRIKSKAPRYYFDNSPISIMKKYN